MHWFTLLFALYSMLLNAPVAAQEVEETTANYAFAVFVGTGKYRIGERTIYVVRAPLAFTLREPDYATRTVGYKLLLPAAIGVTDFEALDDLPDFRLDDLQSGSVAPGLEADIPVAENWLVKPFGQAGLGWDTKSSDNTFIWGLGSRTRAWFGNGQKWLIGGEVLWAGNDSANDNDENTTFTRWAIGTEYKWQTNWRPFNRRVSWHARLIGWWYGNEVNFLPPPDESSISRSTEIGVSFGLDPPINILGYKFRQGGIGYERSSEIRAIKLFTTFPF